MSSQEKTAKRTRHPNVRARSDGVEELVVRAQKGDSEAFRALYELYAEKILNYIYRLTGNREEAEDLTQETFVLVYKNIQALKENSKFQSWLYRIAQNNVFQKFRKKSPRIESIDQEDGLSSGDLENLFSPTQNPEQFVLAGELEQVIQQVLNDLSDKYREVFVLSAIQKLSYQEISEVVGRSLAAVKSDIHRARIQVRDRVKAYTKTGHGLPAL